MKINWKVRAKKKTFWLTLVPALLLLAQIVTSWFGYNFAADLVGEEITRFINVVFAILTILG
ncbi:phage holin, partial [Paraliobacillus ryukyuensis]